jgi:hypothetical protein
MERGALFHCSSDADRGVILNREFAQARQTRGWARILRDQAEEYFSLRDFAEMLVEKQERDPLSQQTDNFEI